ncbi:MAG: hypothetical protein EOO98_11235, partial [Pedobacter sp.]
IVASTSSANSDFDFLNEMDFVPEDTEELEAMGGRGINTQEKEQDDEEEEQDDEFGDSEEDYGSDEYGSEKDDY